VRITIISVCAFAPYVFHLVTLSPCHLVTLSSAVRAAEPEPHRLAGQAFRVLRTHCFECHGPEEKAREGFRALNAYTLLFDARSFLLPGRADASELLILVETGVMPPGTRAKVPEKDRQILRQWIAAGAPSFQGEDYVLRHILEDVRHLTPPDKAEARYLSLNHVLAGPDPVHELQRQRTQLARGLRHLSGREDLEPIDEAETVFRLDLRRHGWHVRPLTPGKEFAPQELRSPNLFDLVLLEYPYGVLPREAEPFRGLVTDYLSVAKPVRPFCYLRADWFADRATRTPLVEVLQAPGAKGEPLPEGNSLERIVSPVAARAELGTFCPPTELRAALRRAGVSWDRPDVPVSRTAWERAFPEAVRQLNLGLPLPPVDGLSVGDQLPATRFDLEVTTNQRDNIFRHGDELALYVSSPRPSFVELTYTDAKGHKFILVPATSIRADQRQTFDKAYNRKPFQLSGPGEDAITVYASDVAFPAGVRWWLEANDQVAHRIIHPFSLKETDQGYELDFDPNRLVRKKMLTLRIGPPEKDKK
jgi:hypothetical protein